MGIGGVLMVKPLRAQIVALPQPRRDGPLSLESALRQRHSVAALAKKNAAKAESGLDF